MKKKNFILDSRKHHSGGNFWHIFLLRNDGHIITIHCEFGDVEISHSKYSSIDEYLKNDDDGFGFEGYKPNYKKRSNNISQIFKNTNK